MAQVQLEAVLRLTRVQIDPRVFQQISRATAGLPASMSATAAATKKTTSAVTGLARQTKKVQQNITGAQRASRLFLRRMAQFAVLLPTFATLNRAIQGSVKFLFDFDSALRDIVRIDISGLAGRMDEVALSALRTANAFGVSAVEVLEVTRIFKQAGFSIEESQKKAQTAILATQVSTLSSAQAVEIFIAAQKQFGKEGQNAAVVLDKLAKVEDLAAVNASDVAEAFRAGGNALSEFAKSIDDSIGLIAALREQTRKSGREIGTFLKTIQTRIFAAGDARSAVEALGVSVENLDGSLRPTLAVLNDLKTAFEGLTESQRANAAKSIAGIRQFESLSAVLRSLDRANELANASSVAAGTADAKRIITDEKLARTLGKLKAAGEGVANALGEAGIADGLKQSLKFATLLFKIFNNIAGVIDTVGSTLLPVLALVGVRVVRAVTGLAAGAAAGVAGAAGAARAGATGGRGAGRQASGIDELNAAAATAAAKLKTLGPAVDTLSGRFRESTASIGRASSSLTQGIRQERLARRQAIIATRQETLARRTSLQRFLAFNLAAFAAPAAINFFTSQLAKSGTITEEAADAVSGTVAQSVGLGLAFGFISKKAGLLAAALSLLVSSATFLIDKLKDQTERKVRGPAALRKASFEALQSNTNIQEVVAKAFANEQNRSFDGNKVDFNKVFNEVSNAKVVEEFIDEIKEQIAGVTDQIAISGLQSAFAEATDAGRRARVAILNVGESLDKIKDPVALRAVNESLGSDAPLSFADDLGLTVRAFGATAIVSKDAATAVEILNTVLSKNFKSFTRLNDVLLDLVSLQDLNRELEQLQLGSAATSDEFIQLRTDAQLLNEAAAIAEQNFGNIATALIRSAELAEKDGGFGIQATIDDDGNVTEAIARARDIVSLILDEVAVSGLAAFQRIRKELKTLAGDDPGLQKFARAFENAIKNNFTAQIASQNAINAVEQSLTNTRTTLAKEQEQAASEAADKLDALNRKILSFGSAVSAIDFAALENVNVGDIESILAGEAKGVSEGVRQLIVSAFDTGLQKAQNTLGSATKQAERNFDALTEKLTDIRMELDAFGRVQEGTEKATRKSRLEIEEQAVVRALENVELENGIKITEARLVLLKAQQKAESEAAEAERQRQQAIEDLAQASFDFEAALNAASLAFDDFSSQKLSELFEKEASAQEDLKSAQSDVLSSTGDLADAYIDLQQAIFSFNGAIAIAQIESNLFTREIAILGGGINSFTGRLQSLETSFDNVLRDANITLAQRITLERQLAEETLSFLANAREEIVNAGIQIFGQTGSENQELQQGISGLQLVAEQLGGSFENFLNLDPQAFSEVQNSLLALPQEFRQQILSALSFLPETTSIGGFSVEQLKEAIGQVGAGVDPNEGLPSIEELNGQQVEQLQKLQDLASRDANLQIEQVIAAQRQVELAEEQLDVAQIAQERAEENLVAVRDAVLEESAILMAASAKQEELTDRVIAAQDASALRQIEKEAQLFAEQNLTFREVGDAIVQGLGQIIGARFGVIGAGTALADLNGGFIPNAAGGLNVSEAAGLLRAGMREKRAMPAGAGLAVANTREAVIPMNKGFIPNFAQGSDIAASLNSLRGIDAGFVAAVSSAIQNSLGNIVGGGNEEQFDRIIAVLEEVRSGIDSIDESNTSIQSSAATTASGATDGAGGTTAVAASAIDINVTTNQRSIVQIAGLDNLRTALQDSLQNAAMDQIEEVVAPLTKQIDAILQVLSERGLITGIGQPG